MSGSPRAPIARAFVPIVFLAILAILAWLVFTPGKAPAPARSTIVATVPDRVEKLEVGEYFVSPQGDDSWSGLRATPNVTRQDGPFATVGRAERAVRDAMHERRRPMTVTLADGYYALAEPLRFAPEDSGADHADITYRAASGAVPVIGGGVQVHGLTVDHHGRWVVHLPEVAAGTWTFNQLWVNGKRRYRPRLPKTGYYTMESEVTASEPVRAKGFDRFRYHAGDIDPHWSHLSDIEVVVFHIWSESRLPISAVSGNRVVQCAGATCTTQYWSSMQRGQRYLLDNVAEALDQPGEWYLDRSAGDLTYIPMPGERVQDAVVIAPRIEQVLVMPGDPAHGRLVAHLHFENLTFGYSAWKMGASGYSFPQADVTIPATIQATGLRDCVFSGCAVVHTGGYAVELGVGCKRNVLDDCAFYDLAGGGIKIGEMAVNPIDEEIASDNSIDNCLIAHAGRMHPASIGVWIGQSYGNRIEHCDIYDLYYSSVSVGWTWGYGPSNAHHNDIGWNHLYDIGQKVLSDMGAIYTLGINQGSRMHHNRIHDVQSFSYGGWGLYNDEGSSGTTWDHNLVYDNSASGYHQHYGQDNRIINNIFAYNTQAQLIRTRDEDHLSFSLFDNIVIYDGQPLIEGAWGRDESCFRLDRNLYWNEHGTVNFLGRSLADWRKSGHDLHSVIADPLFIGPKHGDFTLRNTSPALALGFEPIDYAHIGIVASRASGALLPYYAAYRHDLQHPEDFRAFPLPNAQQRPYELTDDFEDTPVGEKAVDAITNEEPGASVRITDEQAAGGRHSLKFTDAPGLKYRFDPHIVYSPNLASGTVECRFKLRMEPGAIFFHEWRSNGSPYHAGPSLRIESDGSLRAGGTVVMKIPSSTWVSFIITAGVGPAANAHWQMEVSHPGLASPAHFNDLSCDPLFTAVNWLGFVSDADAKTIMYLDDLSIHQRATK